MNRKSKTNSYILTPDQYDAMMTTELEIHIFKTVANEIKNNLKPRKTSILDLCCGTGLLAQMLLDLPGIEFVGVDINKTDLESAREKTKQHQNFRLVLNDALTYKTDLRFDIVTLTSAYHHIENKFKTLFLQKVFKLLKNNGILIIYEKLIRPCKNNKEFAKSNEEFYLRRIEYLKKTESKGLNEKQFNALLNVCTLSMSAKEEYKIDYNYLIKDLDKTGFKVVKEQKIWPNEDLFSNNKVGDFIFVAKKVIL